MSSKNKLITFLCQGAAGKLMETTVTNALKEILTPYREQEASPA